MRAPVELDKAYRLLNHGPVVLVSAATGGRRGIMPAAWVVPLDTDPLRLAAVLSAGSHTRKLIEESGELALSLPVRAQADLVLSLGKVSGRWVEKFAAFDIQAFAGSRVAAPLVHGCAAWIECRLLPEPELRERHDLVLCEAVAAWAEDECFSDGEWREVEEAKRTIHHLGGDRFAATGAMFAARKMEPKKLY